MKFNELTVSRAKKAKRVGRGISAGQGKTAGRGTKGQGSRKSPLKQGFSGGQTPLVMQLPKLRGFKSKHTPAENVYTGQLNDLKQPAIDSAVLAREGLISSPHVNVKLITKGELKAKKIVRLEGASASAIEAIIKAGGSFEPVPRLARPAKKDK
ncbi:MAG TPA: 50S ribosomal protein L15 [Candidatus Saccharimonadales bacterium]|nr:50S ribosomal protein L15 [Candidatus Saccharimonadales bacterium]